MLGLKFFFLIEEFNVSIWYFFVGVVHLTGFLIEEDQYGPDEISAEDFMDASSSEEESEDDEGLLKRYINYVQRFLLKPWAKLKNDYYDYLAIFLF